MNKIDAANGLAHVNAYYDANPRTAELAHDYFYYRFAPARRTYRMNLAANILASIALIAATMSIIGGSRAGIALLVLIVVATLVSTRLNSSFEAKKTWLPWRLTSSIIHRYAKATGILELHASGVFEGNEDRIEFVNALMMIDLSTPNLTFTEVRERYLSTFEEGQ